jgi:hypothetical protein
MARHRSLTPPKTMTSYVDDPLAKFYCSIDLQICPPHPPKFPKRSQKTIKNLGSSESAITETIKRKITPLATNLSPQSTTEDQFMKHRKK